MTLQQTSLLAFDSIQQYLGERQRQVYLALMSLGEATNTMISKASGLPINVVTPRVNELRKLGRVIESKKDPCRITGRMAIYWRVR